eukprot:15123421-Ditylum_brightwellii.AAC.1
MDNPIGMLQSQCDPCLFYMSKVICLVHVDNCLFFTKNGSDIDEVLKQIKSKGMQMTIEDDVAGFLG